VWFVKLLAVVKTWLVERPRLGERVETVPYIAYMNWPNCLMISAGRSGNLVAV